MNKVIAGKTILLNTVTNCTFIADEMDEKVQIGTRKNDKHIECAGELTISVEPKRLHKVNLPEGDDGRFVKELQSLINKYSKENGSNTPDYILANYLFGCLKNWNVHVMRRSDWYTNIDKI